MRNAHPVAAVLAVLVDSGHVLLVRRAHAPDAGRWGFPGGRIEPGETVAAAALRELREETGLAARAGGVLDVIDMIGSEAQTPYHYVLVAIACARPTGAARAADDALELGWFDLGAVAALPEDRRSRGVLALAHRALANASA